MNHLKTCFQKLNKGQKTITLEPTFIQPIGLPVRCRHHNNIPVVSFCGHGNGTDPGNVRGKGRNRNPVLCTGHYLGQFRSDIGFAWADAVAHRIGAVTNQGHHPFPTELGQVDTVRAALGDQALDVVDAEAGHLDWQVDGPEHAVEVLTGAAGGLRLLRARLEDAGGWDAARDELVGLVEPRCERLDGSLVVRDAYLLTVATSRR